MATEHLEGFGKRLRVAMDTSGIRKNVDLAERVGVTEGTIRNLLKKSQPPQKTDVVAKIATELQVRLPWLLHGTGPVQASNHPSDQELASYALNPDKNQRDLVLDPSMGSGHFLVQPDILIRALKFTLAIDVKYSIEDRIIAAVHAYETSLRTGKTDKIEDLTKIFLP